MIKKILKIILNRYYSILLFIFYPKKRELADLNPMMIKNYIFWQKFLNINGARSIPWPVHFTSRVSGKINIGNITAPGMMPHIYINGSNGIDFGDNVYIGPGVRIISTNHDEQDYTKYVTCCPIKIGNNVWIGANAIILPEVQIGNNVIVGAGSVVTKNIPSDQIVAGNPARMIREKKPYLG
jgi:acetyltransferase-like isoleucine patch superfamily enzyme